MEVLNIIKEKPVRFFKAYYTRYEYELVMSVIIPDLFQREEFLYAQSILKISKYPRERNIYANILLTLLDKYAEDKYDYGSKDIIWLAKYIYKKYKKRLLKYCHKTQRKEMLIRKGPKNPFHTPLEALKEFLARDYVFLKESHLQKSDFYIETCNVEAKLVYPQKYKTIPELIAQREKYGITGYTGIHQSP